jgi:hypothetical protein
MAPSERSQQAHNIVVMLFRCCAAGDDPVKQLGIGAIEKRFKTLELRAVEVSEVDLGKSAKDEIALLGSPTPAPAQYPPVSDVSMLLCHRRLLCMSVECTQRCICEFIGWTGGIISFKSAMIHSEPATIRVTM